MPPFRAFDVKPGTLYVKRNSYEKISVDKPFTKDQIVLFFGFSKLHPKTTWTEISDLMNHASQDCGLEFRVIHYTMLEAVALWARDT
jgi:hypothetical protein